MAANHNIHSISVLTGRTVLSRATANKLGQVHDLVIDPTKGELAGISLRIDDQSLRLVEYGEVYSIGPDAVMVRNEESALPPESSPIKSLPLALNSLVEVKVITENGQLLGQIANIYIHLVETPSIIYEVRSSILDKLLGNSLYFPAALGRAFSSDNSRLVVSNDAASADHNLNSLAAHLFGPPKEADPIIVIRSRRD